MNKVDLFKSGEAEMKDKMDVIKAKATKFGYKIFLASVTDNFNIGECA